MDMELVPRYASAEGSSATVLINPGIVQNLGMRVAPVVSTTASGLTEFTATVAYNERELTIVQARADAFVEQAPPLAEGDLVRAGDTLAVLLVPDWVSAQQELIALKRSGNTTLAESARERLLLLGMSEQQIRDGEITDEVKSSFVITAPAPGVIREFSVRPGMRFSAGQTLARINGLSTVWLEVSIPEAQAQNIALNTEVIARFSAFPGREFTGSIGEILPALNERSRSLRARVLMPNPGGSLRPGLTASVTVLLQTQGDNLAVPTESVIHTGRQTLVMVAEGDGRFRPQTVRTGGEIGTQTLVLEGLQLGEDVVVSGQFLLDSEARLQGVAAAGSVADTVMDMPAELRVTEALHEAEGRIVSLSGDEVGLSHGPFPTLRMSGMTMTFRLADEKVSEGLSVGDEVRIGLRQSDSGLVVEMLEPLKSESSLPVSLPPGTPQ